MTDCGSQNFFQSCATNTSPRPVVTGLRRRGLDAVSVQELGWSSATDSEVLDLALTQGRLIYTCDSDFLRLHAKGREHAGILYHRQSKYSIKQAVARVFEACLVLSAQEAAGSVVFL
ncbi:MAG: DUF5615 family PIN-like protein [Candidatus Coatesbacteria bacterium]|nr:DUF5615 family PIN-like protein [Candidatus Coatesbacteria bacterium]